MLDLNSNIYNAYLYVCDTKNKKITHWNWKSINNCYNEFCLFEIFLLFQIIYKNLLY